MKIKLLTIFCLLLFSKSFAQTQFWSDTFEDTGAPSSSTRNASIEFGNGGPPFTRYFKRTDGTDISLSSSIPYSNVQGTKYWAGEDLDGNVTGQSALQTITWPNINISGKTGLSFSGLIAAWNGNPVSDSNSIWEGNGHPNGADFIEIEYSINSGPFTKLLGFYCHTTGNTSGILKLDTNGDLVGDGTTLTRTFQNFSANITGTGSTLTLRLNASNGSLVEEFAFDDFKLLETVLNNEDYSFNTQFSIYPNPSKSIFNINISDNATLEVLDILGKKIMQKTLLSGLNNLDVSLMEKGIYLAKITNTKGQIKTVRLIKE